MIYISAFSFCCLKMSDTQNHLKSSFATAGDVGFSRFCTQLIPDEIKCQGCAWIPSRMMCMHPTSMWFSVMVWANDSSALLSVTSSCRRGGGLSGATKHALENMAMECHIIKTSQKTPKAGRNDVFKALRYWICC